MDKVDLKLKMLRQNKLRILLEIQCTKSNSGYTLHDFTEMFDFAICSSFTVKSWTTETRCYLEGCQKIRAIAINDREVGEIKVDVG